MVVLSILQFVMYHQNYNIICCEVMETLAIYWQEYMKLNTDSPTISYSKYPLGGVID